MPLRQLLDANYARWSLFVCGGMHYADTTWQPQPGLEGGYRLWPLGMNMQLLRRSANIKLDKWTSKSAKLLPAGNAEKCVFLFQKEINHTKKKDEKKK